MGCLQECTARINERKRIILKMTDVLTPEQRHRCMSAIKGRNTKPEMIMRRMVHAMGYRYRLHVRRLPGQPDLVFPKRKKVIFIHGCFWHRHICKQGRPLPATRAEFWQKKLNENKQRDRRIQKELRALGWDVLVVWECWVNKPDMMQSRIRHFLDGT
jgi:DNA mismatch endonuclease (patch repair protein)